MNVLLGIGGSADSLLALEHTVERTAMTGDRLTIAILSEAESDQSLDELMETIEETLDRFDVTADVEVLSGQPGPTLTAHAEANDVDCIVIGGGKRSPMGKIALGDITEFVVLNADTTVTLIR